MKTLSKNGTTSLAEVTNVSKFGIWLYVDGREYFLPYEKFPWFANAPVKQIFNLRRVSENHFYWPDLDVDLSLDIIQNPDKYPLVQRP